MVIDVKQVIIDTDPGTDDILALLMALNSPELEVLGVTTVGGNATLSDTTRNTLMVLDYLGSDVPVYEGSPRPIDGCFQYAYHIHGSGGLDVGLPSPTSAVRSKPAFRYICDVSKTYKGRMTIIALGPLTNLAMAIIADPRLVDDVCEVVIMGGVVGLPGNVTPFAEFNVYSDPRAARIVIDSGIPINLVGLDVTTRISVTEAELPWVFGDTDVAQLARCVIASSFEAPASEGIYHLHDPLAVASVVRPSLMAYRESVLTVVVDGLQRGRTIPSWGNGSVRVATDVDVGPAKALVRNRLV